MEVVVAPVALGTAPSHCSMQAEVHDVICTGIEYPRGSRRIKRLRVMLARLLTMLGSNKCMLSGNSEV